MKPWGKWALAALFIAVQQIILLSGLSLEHRWLHSLRLHVFGYGYQLEESVAAIFDYFWLQADLPRTSNGRHLQRVSRRAT